MKATSIVAAALVAAGNTGYAQEVPEQDARPQSAAARPVTYILPVTFPLLAQAPEPRPEPQGPPATAAPGDRRDDIKTLEAVLTLAVKSGADKLALQMRASEPGSLFVIDTGRTRGFDLQGYGVFFDVDVPMMKQSVLWSTRTLSQQDTRAQLENYIATQPPGPQRDFAIARAAADAAARYAAGLPAGGADPGRRLAPIRRTIRAADVDAASRPPPPPPALAGDPNELYTEAVKSSLIDAMLKYSVGLKLGAEEWLTVAARDAQGPPTPGQPDDASTIVIRIKGSDLAAFHANKLTREEVLKRVEVKEY